MKVLKRNGVEKKFEPEKIKIAISKANRITKEMNNADLEKITGIVENKCIRTHKTIIKVEEIQDIVEDTLLKSRFNHTAKAYILYREERTKYRNSQSELMARVDEKLSASNVVNQNANVDEYSFGGRKGEAANEVMKWNALNFKMCRKSKEMHMNNRIYIHDLDSYAVGQHNCLSAPIDDLLKYGFNTRQTDIRPASSINTAFQLVAVIFQLQSLQQFGGVSATHLDWTMVPYVRRSFRKHLKDGMKYIELLSDYKVERFDKWVKAEKNGEVCLDDEDFKSKHELAWNYALDMTERELKQAVEGMYHNLNTLQSRSGNQLPFTSINYGTCTLPEGRMVIKALLEGSLAGVGKVHKTPIFPCGIFQYKKGVNDRPGTPNYDLYKLALKSTSKRLYPNYSNVDWSVDLAGLKQDRDFKKSTLNELPEWKKEKLIERLLANPSLCDQLLTDVVDGKLIVREEATPIEQFSTMGCRTANGYDICSQDSFINNIDSIVKDGTLYDNFISGAQKDGRGNLAPTTIIMPTLAMEAKQAVEEGKFDNNVDAFMSILDQAIFDAKDMLIERYNYMCEQDMSSAKFMYENNTMYGYVPAEGIKSALRHGTLVIGQLGMAETLEILIGCNQTKPEGMKVAKQIESLFLQRTGEFKKEYHLNFGVYYTPAENLCHTALDRFVAKYGVIPNVSDREYFTNSIHVPVWENVDPFEKVDIESQLTGYSNAGCITYVELEGAVEGNLEALETVVNYAMDHDIPYFAVNVPNDTCLECGFTGEFAGNVCPHCGSHKVQRLRRVTGYLTGDYKTAFNKGKKQEAEQRVKHTGVDISDIEPSIGVLKDVL